jgi:FkbM family methyltransferase
MLKRDTRDLDPILDALKRIESRLERLESGARGAGAVYMGNGRVLTRVDEGHLRLSYLVDGDDRLLVPRLITHGGFEPEVTRFFMARVGQKDHCLDVGANFGYYTVLLARLAWGGRVLGVEPDQRVFELLRDNIFINWAEGVAQARQAAVSDAEGILTLYRRLTRSGNTSIVHLGDDSLAAMGEKPSERFEVAATTIDSLAAQLGGRVDFLKVDVEGAEPLAFRSARRTLADNPGIQIVMEWSPAQIAAAGFDVAAFVEDLAAQQLTPAILTGSGPEALTWGQLKERPYAAGVLLTRR